MTENYYDGEWRPVTDLSFTALEKLRSRGFELGSDRYGKLMARWPIAPAAPVEVGYWVSLPYATFGVWAIEDTPNSNRGVVSDAAPIAYKRAMGKRLETVLEGYRAQGAKVERLKSSDKPPLTFSNAAVIEYWQEEVKLGCAASLARLREICASRGADYDRTIAGLRTV
jgi:hypothetical protein